MSAGEIAKSGIVQCPESRELFGTMTVRENLDLGGHLLQPNARKVNWTAYSRYFRSWLRGKVRPREPFLAASSRCLRSAGT